MKLSYLLLFLVLVMRTENYSAQVDPCTDGAIFGTVTLNDPDADGINNVCDDDDDNDGILDAEECVVTFTPTGVSMGGNAQTYTTSQSGNTFTLGTTGTNTSELLFGATLLTPLPSTAVLYPDALHFIEAVSEAFGNPALNLTIDDVFPDFNGDNAVFMSSNTLGTLNLTANDPDGGAYTSNIDVPDYTGYANEARMFFHTTFEIDDVNLYTRFDFEHREYVDADLLEIIVNGNPIVNITAGNTTHTNWEEDPLPMMILEDLGSANFVSGTNTLTIRIRETNPELGSFGFAGFGRFIGRLDSDGDGLSNCEDLDSDNDGCPDVIEANYTDGDVDSVLGVSPIVVGSNGRVVAQGGYLGSTLAVNDPGSQGPLCSVYLPVELISFEAIKDGSNVNLSWETASEQHNDYFEIQRSVNLDVWNTLGTVKGIGNSNSLNQYTFTDTSPFTGVNYYRLVQVDLNGALSEHGIRAINYNREDGYSIFPNPVVDQLYLDVPTNVQEVLIVSSMGIVVRSKNLLNQTNYIDVSDLVAGIYYCSFLDNGSKKMIRFIKNDL